MRHNRVSFTHSLRQFADTLFLLALLILDWNDKYLGEKYIFFSLVQVCFSFT